jgi:uncharacterized protein YgiM (DUF1202 family)
MDGTLGDVIGSTLDRFEEAINRHASATPPKPRTDTVRSFIPVLALVIMTGGGHFSNTDTVTTGPAETPATKQQTVREVTATSLNLRSDASTASNLIASLPTGTKVTVQEDRGSWLYVTTDEGRSGWVSARFVR